MIDLYTWTTPNGRKASIMLEEIGLPYTAHAVDISKEMQPSRFKFMISSVSKLPALVRVKGCRVDYSDQERPETFLAARLTSSGAPSILPGRKQFSSAFTAPLSGND